MLIPSEILTGGHSPYMANRISVSQLAYFLACAAVVSILFSIAVSQILLALALAALLLSNEKLRFPPVLLPLGLFTVGTFVSMFLSADPVSGRPAIRKLFLFLVLLVVYSTVRGVAKVRTLLLLLTGVATVSAIWSIVQFAGKVRAAEAAGRGFYEFYTAERITGFMSHWMTLGGQEMIVILMAAALLFWGSGRRIAPWLLTACAAILASLILGFTRSMWLGTFCGGVYLLWMWKRWWVLAAPAAILLLMVLNPFAVRQRAMSAFQPDANTDSNEFRYVCRQAGYEMIAAHPFLGLGPEQVRIQFPKWVPPEIPRPLPIGWYGHLHNLYIHMAAERGIPTMLALMWLLGKFLFDFVRALRRPGLDPGAKAVLHGAIAVVIAVLAVGFYEFNLGDSEVLTLFLAVIACGYVAAGSSVERSAEG